MKNTSTQLVEVDYETVGKVLSVLNSAREKNKDYFVRCNDIVLKRYEGEKPLNNLDALIEAAKCRTKFSFKVYIYSGIQPADIDVTLDFDYSRAKVGASVTVAGEVAGDEDCGYDSDRSHDMNSNGDDNDKDDDDDGTNTLPFSVHTSESAIVSVHVDDGNTEAQHHNEATDYVDNDVEHVDVVDSDDSDDNDNDDDSVLGDLERHLGSHLSPPTDDGSPNLSGVKVLHHNNIAMCTLR